jgi:hypothetical protein
LFSNIPFHLFQFVAHGRYRVPARPAMGTGTALPRPPELPRTRHGPLTLEAAENRGHRVLGRDLTTPMDVSRQPMPLHDATFLLPGQLRKESAQARSALPVYPFASILGYQYDVLLALSARRRQPLPPRCCHTILLRLCQQASRGERYSRIAQRSSRRPRSTSGLPPLESYTRHT